MELLKPNMLDFIQNYFTSKTTSYYYSAVKWKLSRTLATTLLNLYLQFENKLKVKALKLLANLTGYTIYAGVFFLLTGETWSNRSVNGKHK